MKKKKKLMRLTILIIAITCISVLLFIGARNLFKKSDVKKPIDVLEKFNYYLNDSATSYHKTLFAELKKELGKEEIVEENYATLISKIFVTDFFTLDNKTSKNDVGGTQFVYKDYQDDFKKYAKDHIYKFVQSNFDGKRKQELPIVKEVVIDNIENRSYEYLKSEDKKAYFIDLKITYESDLEYQTEVSLVLIHSNNKLEIVKMD